MVGEVAPGVEASNSAEELLMEFNAFTLKM
jgi:hypothetical protein